MNRSLLCELMMDNEVAVAEEFRVKAEGIRQLASSMAGGETREAMLRLAADYDGMAETVMEINETRKFIARLNLI